MSGQLYGFLLTAGVIAAFGVPLAAGTLACEIRARLTTKSGPGVRARGRDTDAR